MSEPATLKEWIASRPAIVRRLLAEFPLGTEVTIDGERWYVIGATESEHETLLISPVRADGDYDEMVAKRQHICAHHLREGTFCRHEH